MLKNLLCIVFQYLFIISIYSQNIETEKNITKKEKNSRKFDANFTVAFSIGVQADAFGISKMFNRLATAVKNFQKSSIDNGSKGSVSGSYLFDFNFWGQYNIHRAEFLFIRVGYTYSPLITGNYNIKTKVISNSNTAGLNAQYSFSRKIYGYQMEATRRSSDLKQVPSDR